MIARPDQRLIRQERYADVFGAIERLPGRQRQTMYLITLGFSHGEIAAIMGIEKCTVNKHITRARSGLKREGILQ